MTDLVQDVMTVEPLVLEDTTLVQDAARHMRDFDIGDVLVSSNEGLCGLVTDRDLVVHGLADKADLTNTTLADICEVRLFVVSPIDTVDTAISLMRDHAIRRVPVVDAGRAVGIVSIGDLAIHRDGQSALADISAAPPSR